MSAVQSIAVPPHNLEAEKSVLGAVLLDERHLFGLLVEEHLRPDHFYREQHASVFAGWVPAAGHARDYGRIVREKAQMRALLTASYEIQASVLSPDAPARDLV